MKKLLEKYACFILVHYSLLKEEEKEEEWVRLISFGHRVRSLERLDKVTDKAE